MAGTKAPALIPSGALAAWAKYTLSSNDLASEGIVTLQILISPDGVQPYVVVAELDWQGPGTAGRDSDGQPAFAIDVTAFQNQYYKVSCGSSMSGTLTSGSQ